MTLRGACVTLGIVSFIGIVGCGRLAEMTGYNEEAIPQGATVENVIPTDESWTTIAVQRPLGAQSARSDVKRRWASANYGTHAWRPALAGGRVPTGYSAFEKFEGSKWVWYPEPDFSFGEVNSVPSNHPVVHMRREFYNAMAPGKLADAYVDVMTSGLITVRVFVNGARARPTGVRPRSLHYGATPNMEPLRYVFPEHIVYGKNVIGIEATAHIKRDVDGETVPNYVRDGVIAKVVVR